MSALLCRRIPPLFPCNRAKAPSRPAPRLPLPPPWSPLLRAALLREPYRSRQVELLSEVPTYLTCHKAALTTVSPLLPPRNFPTASTPSLRSTRAIRISLLRRLRQSQSTSQLSPISVFRWRRLP